MSAIRVVKHLHIDRAYTKDITFRRGLHTYHVHLAWDETDGYKLWFFQDPEHHKPTTEPTWVATYQPKEGDDGHYNLAIQLDALCADKGEGRIVEHLQDLIDEHDRLNSMEME